ncbi:hypothetical protein BUALT_Bualt08G0070800 [Buddleja alternifolia]|uniref:Protein kinase domain-containing protein n=1 Tax=Buddleja alternifolia TaxID=168488 RepID=A0AAV6X8D8_9LAMI|nr:hypothetical protein BUALT_Bualt08G0070800 [Buddleja alternifolia]
MEAKILLFFIFIFLNSVATQPVPRLSYVTEWRALLDLRSSLGIRAKDWPKKGNPCLNWTGITCENGHITRINLSGLKRTRQGKLNPRFDIDSLPNFTFLSSFNSSGFLLRGSIPEWLGQRLSNLTVLDLRSSSIDGSIPSSIGSLTRLSSLYLSNNSITGTFPSALGRLLSLSVLDLSLNLLTGQIPSEISSLGNLSHLDLSSNFLSGGIPPSFGSFSRLRLLNLSNNSLSESIPAQLGNLSELIELDLGHNSLMGSLPKELGGLRSLRKMMIGNNQLEGSLFNDIFRNELELLVLCRNYFTGVLPNDLWSMSNLKYLDVSGNNLTGVFPSHIAFFNVTSAVFNFSYNHFYGNLSYGIGNLSIIDVSGNYFEGSPPNYTRGSIVLLPNNCFSSASGQRNADACKKFYSERGIPFGGDEPIQRPNGRERMAYIMVGVFGGLGFVMVVITGILLLLKTCNVGSTNHERGNSNVRSILEGGVEPATKDVSVDFSTLGESFTYEQMLLATCNFSNQNLIKNGHSGDLFQGILDGGQIVVIKRVDLHSLMKESFMSELDLYGKVSSHRRLVPLLGHCLENEHEKLLVYKYMPNGDLSNSLYRLTNVEEQEDLQSLDWITRLKIAIGTAEALSYLHHECNPPILHRDIQASSILLDDKYEVRLGSLSEVCALGVNNHQNMISRLLRQTSGKRTGSSSTACAYDVYSFGLVLLELVTGRLGISSQLNDADAKQWLDNNLPFITVHDKELVIKIVDQSLLIDEDLLEEVWAVAIVAKSCLNPKASRRPSMRHVLKALENPFKVVREEIFSSGASSRRSWTAAFFGSWNHSSSESSNVSGQTNKEIIGGLRQVGSRGSGANDYSSSHKRSSSDVFPEPVEMQDVERQDDST